MRDYMRVKVTQSCLTLCDSMDYGVHGILQARILEWVAFSFSRGSSWPRKSNPGLPFFRQILYQLSHTGSLRILERVAYPFSRGSSWPRNQTGVSCNAGRFFTNRAIGESRCYSKASKYSFLSFKSYLLHDKIVPRYVICCYKLCICLTGILNSSHTLVK